MPKEGVDIKSHIRMILLGVEHLHSHKLKPITFFPISSSCPKHDHLDDQLMICVPFSLGERDNP